ncbi:helix-turn-helix domain-containing protein [Dyadobacter sp. CY351]|uniref:helix-turn-helix domain-containing protein n=1 Tax=Dyadobacter sp. CY351 TaxID=2909337 RepID=UPI001F44DEAD|nr:helix-turn-helix transcriptional regulator [Dyadobacter sp. CY351]MCF2516040.1 helix-turn-helix domain-containing protein [Dyadobacter sp. CY351]
MDITQRIKTIREIRGFRQIDIANKLNLDPSYYARLEKRGSKMTLDQLISIVDAMDVNMSDFMAEDLWMLRNQATKSIGERAVEMHNLCVEHTEDFYGVFEKWVEVSFSIKFDTLVSKGVGFDEIVQRLNNEQFRMVFFALLGYVQFTPPWFSDRHRELYRRLAPYSESERLLLWPYRQREANVRK